MDDESERRRMVAGLEATGMIHDPRVREALLAVPREAFVHGFDAHADAPQPIGAGQTISAPHMVAIMAEALDVHEGDRVLEVGGGSGYHAAVLAHLGGRVVTIEIVPELAARARKTLAGLGYDVEVVEADGSAGHPAGAPYDRMSVAAAAPEVPAPLVEQLAPGGILVIPVGPPDMQMLLRVRKQADGSTTREELGAVRFVPLVGAFGWRR